MDAEASGSNRLLAGEHTPLCPRRMGIFMLGTMRGMYPNRRANLALWRLGA